MKATTIGFDEFRKAVKGKEGLVCLGCGGKTSEWIQGVTKEIVARKLAKGGTDLWEQVYKLKTTGGRIDLAFVFRDINAFDIGRMAIWRLQFGSMSWISDYIPNYGKHF